MPTHRHQAATHESQIRSPIEQQQLAHGIAQIHGGVLIGPLLPRAARQPQALLTHQTGDRIKALRMTRHQDQQRLWIREAQRGMGGKQLLILARVGGTGDPHGARAKPRAKLLALPLDGRINTQIIFERARYVGPGHWHPQLTEALGIFTRLGCQPVELGQCRRHQRA